MTTLKLQAVKDSGPHAHEIDQTGDKFLGDAHGDEVHTIPHFEVKLLSDEDVTFLKAHGDQLNLILGKANVQGYFPRLTLMDGVHA